MGKVMVIDIGKCNGCYNCQVACKDEHCDNDWTPIAAPQPDTGHFWMKVTDIVQGTVPKVRVRYMHHICQHCDEAPCIPACKSKAIYKREDGIVIIDPTKCQGNRDCIKACPYEVIYWNEESKIAQKCTFCAHLLDQDWKEPRCVDACPTGALTFGEESDPKIKELIARAEVLKPEAGAKPRVYYIDLPNKYFIAGAVYDPQEDECLEGAKVTLLGADGKTKGTLLTDDFGDFWFERQEPGTYSLKIELEGYASKTIEAVDASKDVNVGDIELRKA
jgi:Fe-S-cluster-containing dehydrogenase component